MSTFADQLKSEFSRLAREEVRSELVGIRKSVTLHRAEMTARLNSVVSV